MEQSLKLHECIWPHVTQSYSNCEGFHSRMRGTMKHLRPNHFPFFFFLNFRFCSSLQNIFFFFLETGSLCATALAVLEIALYTRLALNSQGSPSSASQVLGIRRAPPLPRTIFQEVQTQRWEFSTLYANTSSAWLWWWLETVLACLVQMLLILPC